jgi:DNA-binding beta-propeller fold protein YncE
VTSKASLSFERRVACSSCKGLIVEGAKKCKHCKAWQPAASARLPRAAFIVTTAVTTVFSVIVTTRQSHVGAAPPLTVLPTESASAGEPSPAAVGPEPDKPKPPPTPLAAKTKWTTREFKTGDAHPLDVAFSANGEFVYVSADDATLREYRVSTGELIHKATVPAKGDHIDVLFDRYVAVLRHDAMATRIPLVDTGHWDRDPILLECGSGPGDIAELPDGTVATATTSAHRVSRFGLPSGRLLSDMTLPQSTGQLFVVRAEGRPYLAAMGSVGVFAAGNSTPLRSFASQPAGAWVDLFDPEEVPFGATRRSIAVGGDPRTGAVTSNGTAIWFPDHASNRAKLLAVERQTEAKTADVGAGPVEAFLFAQDRYGITLNASASTATVVSLPVAPSDRLQVSTLVLPAVPRTGAMTPDRTTLFVALGGTEDPPRGNGVAIIAGDPPEVVTTVSTGQGAIAVAVSKDGARAAVANYFGKTLTILE